MPSTAQGSAVPTDLKAVRRWEVLSLLPNATVSRVNVEKIARRDLDISDWNSLPSAPSAGRDLQEHGLSLADLNEYSISKSTGPDDSFFHLSAHSHKYSNLKGASSSSVGGGRSRLMKSSGGGESPSARTLLLVAHVTRRPFGVFSQSKCPDHQHFTLFYSSQEKPRGSGL